MICDVEAVEATDDYTKAQKESYLEDIHSRLEAIDRDIEALWNKIEAGTNEMKAESKAAFQRALTALRAQKA